MGGFQCPVCGKIHSPHCRRILSDTVDDRHDDDREGDREDDQEPDEKPVSHSVAVHEFEARATAIGIAERIDEMLSYDGCTRCDECFALVPTGSVVAHLAWHDHLNRIFQSLKT
jgi:hypothetical protein